MTYIIYQDLKDPTHQVYGIWTDDFSQLIKVIDMDCNPCELNFEHTAVGILPSPPPCVQ